MSEFQPKIAELIQRGATASMLLDAQKTVCAECCELVLKRIDDLVTNARMTPDQAVGLCHELAAFRRIVHRQEQTIEQGRRTRSTQ